METISGPQGSIKPHIVENPQKTFWFERHDGSIFNTNEREAWTIYNGRVQTYIRAPRPKLIGVSDGRVFQQAVIESHQLFKDGKEEEAKERMRRGRDEELESGRGNVQKPQNYDSVDSAGNPVNRSQL